jgi:hypothetical protein
MSQKGVAILGHNNTRAAVTGQEELLVKVNSISTATSVGAMRTPSIVSSSTTGATSNGVYSVSIANVGSAVGYFDGGVALPAGVTISFDGGAINNTIASFNYDATGTTFLITELA